MLPNEINDYNLVHPTCQGQGKPTGFSGNFVIRKTQARINGILKIEYSSPYSNSGNYNTSVAGLNMECFIALDFYPEMPDNPYYI